MVEDKNPLAAVTKQVPLTGAWIDNAGGESNFVFKSTPQKEAPGKDLLHYIMKNKEDYRIGNCENTRIYALPIVWKYPSPLADQFTHHRPEYSPMIR